MGTNVFADLDLPKPDELFLRAGLSGSGTELATVLRVAKALGMELAARPLARTKAAKPKKAKRVSPPRRAA